jgi:DNA excision repair protein ERCC-4
VTERNIKAEIIHHVSGDTHVGEKDPLLAQKIHILEGFPGIGVDKAERLLLKFGCLQAVFNAEVEDLLNVPGIGKKTVEGMLEILKK